MKVSRRRFLGGVVAASVVYGFSSLSFARDDDTSGTSTERPWLRDALAEMKATGSPGIAIVMPKTREGQDRLRVVLRNHLVGAAAAGKPQFEFDARAAWLAEAVFMIADGTDVGALPGETIVLLEPDGRRAAGSAMPLTADGLPTGARELLRRGGRLRRRADAARTSPVQLMLAAMIADDVAARVEPAAWLRAHFAKVGPAVIAARDEAGSQAWKFNWILSSVLVERIGPGRGPASSRPLPYGTRWIEGEGPDPCPPCGMMVGPPRSRDLLEFLGDPEPPGK